MSKESDAYQAGLELGQKQAAMAYQAIVTDLAEALEAMYAEFDAPAHRLNAPQIHALKKAFLALRKAKGES